LFVGSAVNAIFVDRLVEWIENLFPRPWWELYLEQGFESVFQRVSTAGDKTRSISNPHSGKVLYFTDRVGSLLKSGLDDYQWDVYRSRQRARDEAQFRTHLLLAAFVLGIAVGIVGTREWWFVATGVLTLGLWELSVRRKRVSESMTDKELKRLRAIEARLEKILADPSSDTRSGGSTEVELAQTRSEISQVKQHRFIRQPDKGDEITRM